MDGRIVFKNSGDSEAAITAATSAGGAEEIHEGELVLGLESGDATLYVKESGGSVIPFKTGTPEPPTTLTDLYDTDIDDGGYENKCSVAEQANITLANTTAYFETNATSTYWGTPYIRTPSSFYGPGATFEDFTFDQTKRYDMWQIKCFGSRPVNGGSLSSLYNNFDIGGYSLCPGDSGYAVSSTADENQGFAIYYSNTNLLIKTLSAQISMGLFSDPNTLSANIWHTFTVVVDWGNNPAPTGIRLLGPTSVTVWVNGRRTWYTTSSSQSKFTHPQREMKFRIACNQLNYADNRRWDGVALGQCDILPWSTSTLDIESSIARDLILATTEDGSHLEYQNSITWINEPARDTLVTLNDVELDYAVDPHWDKVKYLNDGSTMTNLLNGDAITIPSSRNTAVRATETGAVSDYVLSNPSTENDFSMSLYVNKSLESAKAWNLGDQDFTLEFWAFPGVNSSASTIFITQGFTMGVYTDSMRFSAYYNGVNTIVKIANYPSPVTDSYACGVWQHAAVTRSGDIYRLFMNGAYLGGATRSGTIDFPTNYNPYILGGGYSGGAFGGCRITHGVARYTASFTPPRVWGGPGIEDGNSLSYDQASGLWVPKPSGYNQYDVLTGGTYGSG